MIHYKKIILLLFTILLGTLFPSNTNASDTIAIRIGTQTVTHKQIRQKIDKIVARTKVRYSQKIAENNRNDTLMKQIEKRARQKAVNNIVKKRLLLHHAKKNKTSIDTQEINKKINAIKQQRNRYRKPTRSQSDTSGLRRELQKEQLINNYVNQKISSNSLTVSDTDIEQYCNENRINQCNQKQARGQIRSYIQKQQKENAVSKLVKRLKEKTAIQYYGEWSSIKE